MSHESVYVGRDNVVELQLLESGAPVSDHTVITRMVLEFQGSSPQADIDSAVNPEFFDFTATDRITLTLGAAGIPAGSYWVTLIVYDAVNTNGIHWEPRVNFIVR